MQWKAKIHLNFTLTGKEVNERFYPRQDHQKGGGEGEKRGIMG